MKVKTLAFAIMASSASLGANAAESSASTASPKEIQAEHEGTYWGVGLGTVLGALVGGPPGAAIGATLGGSLGWGVDNQNALDETQLSLAEKDLAILKRDEALSHQKMKLNRVQQVVAKLHDTNAEQSAQLDQFQERGGRRMLAPNDESTLAKVASHYSHEVYYQNGQYSVPDYAQEKLMQLGAFLLEHPSLEVSLKGYTDQRGSPELNKKLAQARSEGVKDFLVVQGVSGQRIGVQAIGEGELKAKPGEVSNYALDRRVAIELKINSRQNEETEDQVASLTDTAKPLVEARPVSAPSTTGFDIDAESATPADVSVVNGTVNPVDEETTTIPSILSFAEAR